MMFRTVRSVSGSDTCGPLYDVSSTVILDGSVSCTSFSDFLEVTDDVLAGKDKKRDGHLCGHCHPVNITIAQLHVKDS